MPFFNTYIKYTYLLPGLFFAFYSCQSPHNNSNYLAFNPALHQEYYYTLTKISSQQWMYHQENHVYYDTIKISFTIQNTIDTDSMNLCKITFKDFVIKRPPFKFSIIGAAARESLPLRNPFFILDSLGHYIQGLCVGAYINNKGIVKQVNGANRLISTIARLSHSPEDEARRLLPDYVGSNAIADLLNRIFSVPPGAIVNINDIWVKGITFFTKVPVKVDNLYTLNQRHGDSAYLNVNSERFARKSEGDIVYLKGHLDGNAIISYSTGMPYDYETNSETHTTTTFYIVTEKEQLKLKRVTGFIGSFSK